MYARLPTVLLPVVRKTRDLLHHVSHLYHELHIRTHSSEGFDGISLSPARDESARDATKVAGLFEKVSAGVAHLNGTFRSYTREFESGLSDPEYGKSLGDKYRTLGMVAGYVRNASLDLVNILNNFYRSSGFRPPFGFFELGGNGGSVYGGGDTQRPEEHGR